MLTDEENENKTDIRLLSIRTFVVKHIHLQLHELKGYTRMMNEQHQTIEEKTEALHHLPPNRHLDHNLDTVNQVIHPENPMVLLLWF